MIYKKSSGGHDHVPLQTDNIMRIEKTAETIF